MVVIRTAQLQAMQRDIQSRLPVQIRELLKYHRPTVADEHTDDELDVMIRNGIERARGHGIVSNRAVYVFVDLMFAIAPNFDECSLVSECLMDSEGTPDDRLFGMIAIFGDEDWKEVSLVCSFSSWGLEVD